MFGNLKPIYEPIQEKMTMGIKNYLMNRLVIFLCIKIEW